MSDGFGKYELYTTTGSLYCYKGTDVLINRFGLRDGKLLKQLEADVTSVIQGSFLEEPVKGRFTPNHLCRIHRALFGDLYPFAGHYRREDILKGSTRFLDYKHIKNKTKQTLDLLQKENCLHGAENARLLSRAAWYFAELNYIHPFREGNGRTLREFMRLLLLSNGYSVQWSAVPREELLQVMELSVYDPAPLDSLLRNCVTQL